MQQNWVESCWQGCMVVLAVDGGVEHCTMPAHAHTLGWTQSTLSPRASSMGHTCARAYAHHQMAEWSAFLWPGPTRAHAHTCLQCSCGARSLCARCMSSTVREKGLLPTPKPVVTEPTSMSDHKIPSLGYHHAPRTTINHQRHHYYPSPSHHPSLHQHHSHSPLHP